MRSIRTTLDEHNSKLEQARRSSGDRLAPYASRDIQGIRNVINEIEVYAKQGRWFGFTPVGPFGLHVTLNKREYSKILETLLAQSLNSFAVENHNDHSLLQSILKRHQCYNPVLKVSRDSFDYSQGVPDRSFLTALHCLEISNELVLRQLIIHNQIEKTVLVRTHNDGDRITESGFPRNVSGVYTSELQKCGSKDGLSITAMKPYTGIPRLAGLNQDYIQNLEAQISQKMQDSRVAEEALGETSQEKGKFENEVRRLKTKLAQLDKILLDTEFQITETRDAMVEENPGAITDLETLYREVTERIDIMEVQLNSTKGEEKRINFQLGALMRQGKEASTEKNALIVKRKNLNTEQAILAENSAKRKSNRNHYQNQKKKYENEAATYERDFNAHTTQLALTIDNVRETFPDRMTPTDTIQNLEKERRRLEARIREREAEYIFV